MLSSPRSPSPADRPAAKRRIAAATLAAAMLAILAPTARADWRDQPDGGEWELSQYTGFNINQDADVEYEAPGGTDLTFEDVPFEANPFNDAPFYGGRLTYWLKGRPQIGVGLEYTHLKLVAEVNEVVQVTGTRGGSAVDARERFGDTIALLEIANGLNIVMFDGFYRFNHDRDWNGFIGRFQPYLGLGLGFAYAHPTTRIGGAFDEGYQFAGLGVQGVAGTKLFVHKHVSVFAEYRLSWFDLELDVAGGGVIEIQPIVHQFILGLNFHF